MGVAATVGILIAGQLAMGAAIDRWGLFGSERIALHWPRLLGIWLPPRRGAVLAALAAPARDRATRDRRGALAAQMNPFGHMDLRVASLAAAEPFYDALLPALGFTARDHRENRKGWATTQLS